MLVYPVFVHLYLELVYNDHEDEAIKFFERFNEEQEDYLQVNTVYFSLLFGACWQIDSNSTKKQYEVSFFMQLLLRFVTCNTSIIQNM